ncbi:MAG: valine--tRNA ligase [Spirochaetales bacterium]|nr:valine--tRNA ligase [Spirochaetales bacterium]
MPQDGKKYIIIDPLTVPRHFDAAETERRLHEAWQKEDVYAYNPEAEREETFAVDTPPPTVSGSLHIGHVFSYTHTDFIVRYQRMKGKNIFYPMGWDDNGLPTERRVQNYYHVRCEPTLPYEENLKLEQATAKQRKERARLVSRQNFIELCHILTAEDEKIFMDLWQRSALSVDWNEQYATIDDTSRHTAQLSFLDLYKKGFIYCSQAPSMWDVDFGTAIAQAEIEDREEKGAYHHIAFGVEGDKESFIIATTRPELIAACVGVTAHPEDRRYQSLFGKKAITPLYQVPVPIFPSEAADPEKGTGILMVCTFGDAMDVEWWREENLELRQVMDRDGTMLHVDFSEENWKSRKPETANRFYAEIAGKSVQAARRIVVEQLKNPEGSAVPAGGQNSGPPLRKEPEEIVHPVKYFEKGSRPLEFIPTRQWFVSIMDKKELLIKKGREIKWHPDYMRIRFENWTENLQFDWCISRQRFFGVSFPVWYPVDADGRPDHEHPILAGPDQLPVDPMIDSPAGYDESMRNQPGGFTGESDVFDTWFTSSMSPQIASSWIDTPERYKKLFPMDLRPQAHEIIRTWAFYTIVKAALHEDTIPWKHAVISGFIVDPDRKKMSKSKGNVVTPMDYLDQYGVDAVRYWAAQANLGTDMAFEERQMQIGRRLVTKVFNAGKFALSQNAPVAAIDKELDRAFIDRLRGLVVQVTEYFENFEFARVISAVEDFFWHSYTDTYIELAKTRARSSEGSGSAVAGLRTGLSVLLRLMAPFLPYITEEIWSWAFAEETGARSIHRAPWPAIGELSHVKEPASGSSFETAVNALASIHKEKTLAHMSAGAEIESLTVKTSPQTAADLRMVIGDVIDGARVRAYTLEEDTDVPPGTFAVENVVFAKKDEKDRES